MPPARPALSVLVVAAALAAGCGSSNSESRSGPTGRAPASDQDTAERAQDRLDTAVEDTNNRLLRAARRGDKERVAREERRLDHLARKQAASELPSKAADPFTQEIDAVVFQAAPLFIQRIESYQDSHRLFAAVLREQFCGKSRADRLAAVGAFFDPIDRRLRAAGVDDFRLFVVPLTEEAASPRDALATATEGRARLTGGCSEHR